LPQKAPVRCGGVDILAKKIVKTAQRNYRRYYPDHCIAHWLGRYQGLRHQRNMVGLEVGRQKRFALNVIAKELAMDLSHCRLSDEAMSAANRGQLVEAIKIARADTGLGLKEAKDLVDAYLAGNPVPDLQASGFTENTTLPGAVIAAAESGNTMEAIRMLRTETGLGLKEAKDAVDAYMARNSGNKNRSRTIVMDQGSQWLKIALAALLLSAAVAAVMVMTGKS
jgi:ribosomal protein L7/L12